MRYLILVLLFFGSGCGTLGTSCPPPGTGQPHNPQAPLFAMDNALISDAEIARILDTRIQMPSTFRVGVVYLDHERQEDGYTLGPLTRMEWPVVTEAFAGLQENERVYDVSYLPDLLIPSDFSSGPLRAAAARYQADWILIFQTRTRIITKSPLLSSNQARAYCAADCLVLDVRTGLIAFSSRSRVSLTKEESDQEWSLAETVGMVEQEAIEEAMSLNMEKLVNYIGVNQG